MLVICFLHLFILNEMKWLMVLNIIYVCYLFARNFNLSIQGSRWSYSSHYIFQTFEKWKLLDILSS